MLGRIFLRSYYDILLYLPETYDTNEYEPIFIGRYFNEEGRKQYLDYLYVNDVPFKF